MPFIRSYNGAMKLLSEIGTGKCKGTCKSSWIRNFKYALKTKTNPLGLNKKQRNKQQLLLAEQGAMATPNQVPTYQAQRTEQLQSSQIKNTS